MNTSDEAVQAVREHLPAEFLERLSLVLKDETPETINGILASMAGRRLPTFRINTLKARAEDVLQELSEAGFKADAISWLPNAYVLTEGTQRALTELPIYIDGKIYLQSTSSMIPALILDPKPGEYILDLAAAPGSKTTQMAALMGNEGQIVANDASTVRLYKLRANLTGQGATNVRVTKGYGEKLWQKFPEMFDKTLVDVPCSMEGRFSLAEPTSYDDWSYHKVRDVSIRQAHLLRSAISATKPGGTIVYSTCTLSPEENEHVIQWALNKEAGNIEVEPIQSSELLQLTEARPGMDGWEKEKFDSSIKGTLRILPGQMTEGFYVAKLRKIGSSLPTTQQRPFRPSHRQFKHRRRR